MVKNKIFMPLTKAFIGANPPRRKAIKNSEHLGKILYILVAHVIWAQPLFQNYSN